ncbi:hypothetical protein LTR50_004160 [Elasticomyces elasticus]|nr:hypothetical protein LTR50_004160 [Elasticomyces elasticus]
MGSTEHMGSKTLPEAVITNLVSNSDFNNGTIVDTAKQVGLDEENRSGRHHGSDNRTADEYSLFDEATKARAPGTYSSGAVPASEIAHDPGKPRAPHEEDQTLLASRNSRLQPEESKRPVVPSTTAVCASETHSGPSPYGPQMVRSTCSSLRILEDRRCVLPPSVRGGSSQVAVHPQTHPNAKSLLSLRTGQGVRSHAPNSTTTHATVRTYEDTQFDQEPWAKNIVKARVPTSNLIDVTIPKAREQQGARSQIGSVTSEEKALSTINEHPLRSSFLSKPEIREGTLIDLADIEFPAPPTLPSPAILQQFTNATEAPEPKTSQASAPAMMNDDAQVVERLQLEIPIHLRQTMGQRKPSKGSARRRAQARQKAAESSTPTIPDEVVSDTRASTQSQAVQSLTSRSDARPVIKEGDVTKTSVWLMESLDHARSFRGSLIIKVQLGQIILQTQAKALRSTNLDPTEMELILNDKQGGPPTEFSSMLTRSAFDIEHLLNITDTQGQRAFAETHCHSKMYYEYVCADAENETVSVTTPDHDAEITVSYIPQIIGSQFLHYPKRVWDGRITVSGKRTWQGPTNAAQELVHHISCETRDDSETERPLPHSIRDISTKILRVQKILLRRMLHFRSQLYPDLAIEVMEVRRLQFASKDGTGEFIAQIQSASYAVSTNQIWYEACIVPYQAVEAFQENVTLELGEDASWKPEHVANPGFIEAMKGLTGFLVTRMDGIGFANVGMRGGPDDVVLAKERERRTATVEHSFW